MHALALSNGWIHGHCKQQIIFKFPVSTANMLRELIRTWLFGRRSVAGRPSVGRPQAFGTTSTNKWFK